VIRYKVTTYFPQSHIQVCYIIGATGAIISDSSLGGKNYYGTFVLEGEPDCFERLSLVPDISLEIL